MAGALAWFEQEGDRTRQDWVLEIPVEEILRMQAADAAVVQQRNPLLMDMAMQARTHGATLVKPAALYRIERLDGLRHERLLLKGGQELQSKLLSEHLKSATFIVIAVCTIGPGVEQLASREFARDPIYGLALEGFGSAAVETLATTFCTFVDQKAKLAGMTSSIPLSPGMVGWSVDQGQRQLFQLVDPSLIGVKLTESFMMSPAKTISLVLGVGDQMVADGSTCDFCNMRERCHYRDHYSHV